MEVRVDGGVSRTCFRPAHDSALLHEEVAIPGRDAVYEEALARTLRLASPVSG
jgi:hypothetical protein